jgi:hypothetical protein
MGMNIYVCIYTHISDTLDYLPMSSLMWAQIDPLAKMSLDLSDSETTGIHSEAILQLWDLCSS